MEIKFTISNLDVPNKNGRIYPKETINKLFEQQKEAIDNKTIPIVCGIDLADTDDFSNSKTLGFCSLTNKYPEIEGQGFINDKYVHDLNGLEPALAGFGNLEENPDGDSV